MLIRIPLDSIQHNPFQKRFDYGGIEELAGSIRAMQGARPETSGLLQVPPARLWDVGAERSLPLEHVEAGDLPALLSEVLVVQLAAGHRRLEAFRHLRRGELGREMDAEYLTFPLELQELTDEQMVDVAWVENAQRLDPNPIEEALMLEQAMERFGWTQEQVAKRWRLSRSGVANKLRLLKLPEDAQGALRRGEIGERHGRLLLSAMGKSPTVYEQFRAEVLIGAPPAAEAVARARALQAERFTRVRAVDSRDLTCVSCGNPIEAINEGIYHRYVNGEYVKMCAACYRAATDWTPPSSAEADRILSSTVANHKKRLDDVHFPLDVGVGEGDPAIHAARCQDCPYRHEEGTICLDAQCAAAKTEYWRGYQTSTFVERLRIQFGAIAPLCEGYGGSDLSTRDEVDVALVRDGICAPGKCDRLRFKRVLYTYDAICPFQDLPFIYNCNHSGSHKTCQRRWREAQRTADEVEAEKLAKRVERRNQEQAKALQERAVAAVARALQEGNETVWWRLARVFDSNVKKGQLGIDGYMAIVAGRVLGSPAASVYDWGTDNSIDNANKLVAERLRELGVKLPPTTDDVAQRIERIAGFVLDEADQEAREDLTPEQVDGNLANLDQIAVDLLRAALDTERSSGQARGTLVRSLEAQIRKRETVNVSGKQQEIDN